MLFLVNKLPLDKFDIIFSICLKIKILQVNYVASKLISIETSIISLSNQEYLKADNPNFVTEQVLTDNPTLNLYPYGALIPQLNSSSSRGL